MPAIFLIEAASAGVEAQHAAPTWPLLAALALAMLLAWRPRGGRHGR